MSWTILTATLGAIELPLAAEQDIPSLAWSAKDSAGGRTDVPRMGRLVAPEIRTLPLDLIRETDEDEDSADLRAWVSSVNAALSVPNVLVLTTSEGEVGSFNTRPSDPLPTRINWLLRGGGIYRGTAEIRVEPYALGNTDTAGSADDLETPGSVDLSGMDGEYPTPLNVTVTDGASTPGQQHSIHLALCPDKDWRGYLVEATAVAGWDDEVADSGTADIGATVVRFAAGAGSDSGLVDVTGFPRGAYLVLAHVKVAATGTLTLEVPLGDEGPVTREPEGGAVYWDWLPIGQVVLPSAKTRGAATASLEVTGSSATAPSYCHRLCFLPLNWGYVAYHDTADPLDSIISLRAEWEDIYVDDVVDFENVIGGGLKCLGGQLIVLVEEAEGTSAHRHCDVNATYRPRRNWLG